MNKIESTNPDLIKEMRETSISNVLRSRQIIKEFNRALLNINDYTPAQLKRVLIENNNKMDDITFNNIFEKGFLRMVNPIDPEIAFAQNEVSTNSVIATRKQRMIEAHLRNITI